MNFGHLERERTTPILRGLTPITMVKWTTVSIRPGMTLQDPPSRSKLPSHYPRYATLQEIEFRVNAQLLESYWPDTSCDVFGRTGYPVTFGNGLPIMGLWDGTTARLPDWKLNQRIIVLNRSHFCDFCGGPTFYSDSKHVFNVFFFAWTIFHTLGDDVDCIWLGLYTIVIFFSENDDCILIFKFNVYKV